MADDWKGLLVGYRIAVGRAAQMVTSGRIRVSTQDESIDWADLEQRLTKVHQKYETGMISHVHVAKKDEPQFKILLHNLNYSTKYLDNPQGYQREAVKEALGNLRQHTLLLMNAGPHGPITGRPKIGGKKTS